MTIRRYVANKDTTITNAYKENLTTRATSGKDDADNDSETVDPKIKEIKSYDATVPIAASMIRKFLGNRHNGAKADIINMDSLYTSSPDNLSVEERHSYSKLFLAAQKPTQVASENGFLNNLLLIARLFVFSQVGIPVFSPWN